MDINTRYFGVMQYIQDEIITFKDGIFGFEDNKNYILIRFDNDSDSFLCLQNIEDENLAFVVVNPFYFMPDYKPELSKAELDTLNVDLSTDLLFYNLCVLNNDIKKSSVNLRCPLAVNADTHQAIQVILDNVEYSFKQPLDELKKEK